MILSFSSSGDLLLVGIGKNRELSIGSEVSGYIFIRIEDLGELRSFTGAESSFLVDTIKMVKSLSSIKEIRDYIVVEMDKLGFSYTRDLPVKEYKKIVGVDVDECFR